MSGVLAALKQIDSLSDPYFFDGRRCHRGAGSGPGGDGRLGWHRCHRGGGGGSMSANEVKAIRARRAVVANLDDTRESREEVFEAVVLGTQDALAEACLVQLFDLRQRDHAARIYAQLREARSGGVRQDLDLQPRPRGLLACAASRTVSICVNAASKCSYARQVQLFTRCDPGT